MLKPKLMLTGVPKYSLRYVCCMRTFCFHNLPHISLGQVGHIVWAWFRRKGHTWKHTVRLPVIPRDHSLASITSRSFGQE